jgi:hypothetical protein
VPSRQIDPALVRLARGAVLDDEAAAISQGRDVGCKNVCIAAREAESELALRTWCQRFRLVVVQVEDGDIGMCNEVTEQSPEFRERLDLRTMPEGSAVFGPEDDAWLVG